MAIFEQPEMQVVKAGEVVPIKLTFKGIGQKLEDLIAEKLNAHETGEHVLTCAEIHELASSYAELSKVGWPLDWWKFSDNEPPAFEVNCNAGNHE